MNKAVFLDRDGVLNRDFLPYQFRREHFFINDDVWEVLKEFQQKKYLLIIISNQGGIAKGLYTKDNVYALFNILVEEGRKEGVSFTEIYFCPHHDIHGRCICRKPDSLMLEKAMARFDINPAQSYFIGDTERDVLAGIKAGVNSIRIIANQSLKKIKHYIQ